MKITAAVALAAIGLAATVRAEPGEHTVVVYVSNEHVAMDAGKLARGQASKMFAKIGIEVQWRVLTGSEVPAGALVIDFVEHSLEAGCAGALGCAKPYEGVHIRVFYDRVANSVGKDLVPALLCHVMVHEITHILQCADHHSASGVMKAHWDTKDFFEMRRGGLAFTSEDIELIEVGLRDRGERLALGARSWESARLTR